jgi:hypothetical protein
MDIPPSCSAAKAASLRTATSASVKCCSLRVRRKCAGPRVRSSRRCPSSRNTVLNRAATWCRASRAIHDVAVSLTLSTAYRLNDGTTTSISCTAKFVFASEPIASPYNTSIYVCGANCTRVRLDRVKSFSDSLVCINVRSPCAAVSISEAYEVGARPRIMLTSTPPRVARAGPAHNSWPSYRSSCASANISSESRVRKIP